MKTYKIIYQDASKIEVLEGIRDVRFERRYITVDLEDEDNTVEYIPYYRIVKITRTGQNPINEDYGHP